ncbi:hypothetical protein IWQ60_009906 [Tieghemiomyces parasiticus]|uniref:Pre-mRNA-processing factor 19 n=1 Tax=Tieghemiomyces parasiticus TaxID=78921 RepID=A0A9W8DNK6_9FUNG|nr:hypothetical protein IWQ60_009906 [Tieghemiomyces parasiticus]
MLCAISGERPETPVVSTKSGHVYEKRLIEKYIAEHGSCPVTGNELTEDDLVEIRSEMPLPRPKLPNMTSIPSLLGAFQDEWDNVMLESYTLRQQQQQLRQELAQALYQNDAAARVIARLIKERDAAREALTNVQAHVGPNGAPAEADAMQVEGEHSGGPAGSATATHEEEGMGESVLAKIDATAKALSKTRKKRKAPAGLTDAEAVTQFTNMSTAPSMHSSTKPGVTCLAVDASGDLVLTGGEDHHVQIYQSSAGQIRAVLKGHGGPVRCVAWGSAAADQSAGGLDIVLSASADQTVRVWHAKETSEEDRATTTSPYACIATVHAHNAEVTGLAVHPSGAYFASASMAGTWCFHELTTGRVLTTVQRDGAGGFTAAAFHPDGIILGTGATDGAIQIWNIKTQTVLATFAAHTAATSALAFSENGYYLAAASHDYSVRVWDLRKQTVIHTIELDTESGTPPLALAFDYSGNYLAVGGVDIRIFQAKTWKELVMFDDNQAPVTGVAFASHDARTLVVSSLDRTLRYYGLPAQES